MIKDKDIFNMVDTIKIVMAVIFLEAYFPGFMKYITEYINYLMKEYKLSRDEALSVLISPMNSED